MPKLTLSNGASTEDEIELLALHLPDDPLAAAALLKKSEAYARDLVEKNDDAITAARLRLTQVGGTLGLDARRFAVRVLARFANELDDLDTMEAASLLKLALRVIEVEDRVEQNAKEQNPRDNLPIVNIVIGSGARSEPSLTVDVDAVEVKP